MNWKIPLFRVHNDESDVNAVTKVITRGSHWADGPEIGEFEGHIAKFAGRKYAVTFNSGTSALHAVLLALDVKGGEVIVPSFTFPSTVNAVVLAGATPVFADIEKETFGLDVRDTEGKITNRTKAIVVVHYAGCGARDTKKLRELCDKRSLFLIEDAAESLGAEIHGKKIGTFGDAAMFSFCQNKIITTGEGGAIVTDDMVLHEKLKMLRSHGRASDKNYFETNEKAEYVELGYNYRMPTMCAALGIAQLKKIDMLIEKRQAIASMLNDGLSKINDIRCPMPPTGFKHVYQLYTIILGSEYIRDELQRYLNKEGIMSKVYFSPVHLERFYSKYGYNKGDLPNTENVSGRVLSLPIYPDISQKEVSDIMIGIGVFFKNRKTKSDEIGV